MPALCAEGTTEYATRMGKPYRPGIGILVGLGLLGFSAYLIWYGTRHLDTEPLYIAAGVFPLSLAVLAWYLSTVHKAFAAATVFALVAAFGGFGWMSWQSSEARREGFRAQRERTRTALPLCRDGVPLANAPAYDLNAGNVTISVIGSVYGDDRPLEWIPWRREQYPAGWYSEGVPQLVACMRNDYVLRDSQTYTGSGGTLGVIQARQHYYDRTLRGAHA